MSVTYIHAQQKIYKYMTFSICFLLRRRGDLQDKKIDREIYLLVKNYRGNLR